MNWFTDHYQYQSASSKMFWPYSIFFEPGQIFLIMVKSDILPYNFGYLSMVKNIWTRSKTFEHVQKRIWTTRWISHKIILYNIPNLLDRQLEFLLENIPNLVWLPMKNPPPTFHPGFSQIWFQKHRLRHQYFPILLKHHCRTFQPWIFQPRTFQFPEFSNVNSWTMNFSGSTKYSIVQNKRRPYI